MFDNINLRLKCSNCKKVIPLKVSAYSRMDLENIVGTVFSISCVHCFKKREYHVNEVKAYENINPIILIFTFSLGIVSLLILFIFLSQGIWIAMLGLTSPFAIYLAYKRIIANDVNTFNKHFITRKTHYFPKNPKRLK